MWKKICFIVVLLLSHLVRIQGDNRSSSITSVNQRVQFVKDFLDVQVNTNQLFIYLCKNKDFKPQISQSILTSFYSHIFINDENLLETFQYNHFVLWLEMGCTESMELLTKGSKLGLFIESTYWLVFDDFNASISTNIYLPINCNVFLATQHPNSFRVKTVFKYSYSDGAFTEDDIGEWISNGGFKYFRKLSLLSNRSNLMGSPLKVSFYYSNIESLKHTSDFRQVDKDNLMKINYILLSAIAEYLNATYVPSFTPTFGLAFDEDTNMYEDNSMMGDVQRQKADIMGVTGWVEQTRLRFFRFFGPTTPDAIQFIFRAPPISILQNVYLMPFDVISWYFIGATLLIGIGVLFLILIEEKRFINVSADASIVDVIMIFLSALLQKTWDLDFKSFSGRLSLTVTYLSFMVIFNAYSASIIVFLQGTSETIGNFEELYYAKFDIGVHDVNYNQFYFLEPNERTNEYWRSKIYREKILKKGISKFFLPLDTGIEKVRTELYAFQSQTSSAHYLINKIFTQAEKCTVRYVDPIYRVDNVYLGTQKNSAYINHYEVGMRRMFEHGLHRRAHIRLFTRKLPCEGNISYFSGIGITDTKFIYAVFISGLMTSLVILALEISISKCRNSTAYFELLRQNNLIYPFTE